MVFLGRGARDSPAALPARLCPSQAVCPIGSLRDVHGDTAALTRPDAVAADIPCCICGRGAESFIGPEWLHGADFADRLFATLPRAADLPAEQLRGAPSGPASCTAGDGAHTERGSPGLTALPGKNFFLTYDTGNRLRFQLELEFVQCLANPNYLNFLAQRGYFKDKAFVNYLKYLLYWKEPEYAKYLKYPQCLHMLELLQYEHFRKELVNAQCAKFIDEQQILHWQHYSRKRMRLQQALAEQQQNTSVK
ncbi:mediator of RNA polymerase II transcription subunit 31 isoform X1 [Excalfactoria chinensis]|uniref:mediator of RNA polymerase II transcription subunit 31 isoform X1 n=1 Tax=Excalfactoria chinensis TaxID=46218 RepID=UPI003B3AE8C2